MTPATPAIPGFGVMSPALPLGPAYGSGTSLGPASLSLPPFAPQSSVPSRSDDRTTKGAGAIVKKEPRSSPVALNKPAAHSQSGVEGNHGGQQGNKQHSAYHFIQPVERLSRESQKRGFNPQWIERHRDSWYECDVLLKDDTVNGDERSPTAQMAKQRCAIKALEFLKGVPRPVKVESPAIQKPAHAYPGNATGNNKKAYSQRELKRATATIPSKAPTTARGTGASSWEPDTASSTRDTTRDDPRELVQQVQAAFGGRAPSLTDLDSQGYSRAYLQGVAAGVAMQQAIVGAGFSANNAGNLRGSATTATASGNRHGHEGYSTYHDRRGRYDRRERSPSGDRDRRYRDRSSPSRRR
ncbi:hypothetical protein F5Y18DRAFT_146203 [Xylariaceae sp. FL1019]|nr:hypothetical protein F5Y18DRAFT_146203 [Xylariaceae sp. FL1019]